MIIETENKNLYRDTQSRAILINDEKNKRKFQEQKKLEERLNNIENDINTIKELLKKIIIGE